MWGNNEFNNFVTLNIKDPELQSFLTSKPIDFIPGIKERISDALIRRKNFRKNVDYWEIYNREEIELTINYVINELDRFVDFLLIFKETWIDSDEIIDIFKQNIERILYNLDLLFDKFWNILSSEQLKNTISKLEIFKNIFISTTMYFLIDSIKNYDDIDILLKKAKNI